MLGISPHCVHLAAMPWLLALWCLLVPASGCRTAPRDEALQRFEFQQPHMGTVFTLTFYARDSVAALAAAQAASTRIQELNDLMTDYDPESELMRLSRSPTNQPVPVSAELFAILEAAQHLSRLSDGAFDVTVGPYVRYWRRARRNGQLPSPENLARAAQSVGWQKLQLDPASRSVTLLAPNMQLDLGGIAKGWAADAALATLREQGCPRAMVAASGDIALGDPPPGARGWRVGLGLPGSRDSATSRDLLLANTAVSTSGDTEQFTLIGGIRYSHIVDPRTGLGLTNQLQASVVAPRAGQTDPLATTICVLGWPASANLVDTQHGAAAVVIAPSAEGPVLRESSRFRTLPQAKPANHP